MEKDTIDGKKTIIQNPTEKQRQEHEKVNLLELPKNNGFFFNFHLRTFPSTFKLSKIIGKCATVDWFSFSGACIKMHVCPIKKNVAQVGIEPQTIRFSI